MIMIAHRFHVLGEPTRIRLLHSLYEGERNVSDLVALCRVSQTNVSRHLQTLADAGIVGRRRAGAQVFYSITDRTIFELCDLVCRSLEIQHTARAAQLSRRTAR